MPVPLIKARGQQRRMIEKKIIAWPPPRSAASGPGQALQGDSLPDPAGRVGGEGTGDSTPGGVLQLLGGWVGGKGV
jgi:hypothetical protein